MHCARKHFGMKRTGRFSDDEDDDDDDMNDFDDMDDVEHAAMSAGLFDDENPDIESDDSGYHASDDSMATEMKRVRTKKTGDVKGRKDVTVQGVSCVKRGTMARAERDEQSSLPEDKPHKDSLSEADIGSEVSENELMDDNFDDPEIDEDVHMLDDDLDEMHDRHDEEDEDTSWVYGEGSARFSDQDDEGEDDEGADDEDDWSDRQVDDTGDGEAYTVNGLTDNGISSASELRSAEKETRSSRMTSEEKNDDGFDDVVGMVDDVQEDLDMKKDVDEAMH